ncbi:MAG: DsbC family protein [Aliarcobacter sp.]|nr:DsbC family protein [Aliarcobacter sp.]
MKKNFLGIIAIMTSSLLFANSNRNNINYELQLINSVIPNTVVSKYEPSEIQGFYKVYLDNGNLFYVNPFSKLLLFGEIWTNNGFSITQNDRTQWQQELSKTLVEDLKKDYKSEDLKKAAKKIKYGTGSKKYEYVLFTDPECPYCKITEEYFENDKNLDLYIVFTPLDFHKNAKDWSLKALSSKDLKQAIKDIKENKIPNVEITETAKKDFQAMQDLSNKLKVNGTPRIIVIDKKENAIVDSIEGANLEAIEKYQKQNN